MIFVILSCIRFKLYRKDERLKLYKLVCEKDSRLKALQGKKVLSKLEKTEEKFIWKELFISPFTIYLEE